jgi:hypothetical protein
MTDPAFTDFVERHLQADPASLVLQFAGKKTEIDIKAAATQIAALQKIRHKVPDWYRVDARFPTALAAEQCSSQATALYKSRFARGKTVLDLSGGLGIDTFYFAKVAKSVLYVEPQAALAQSAEGNFQLLGAQNITCITSTAEAFLATNTTHFDLIYLDPDRRAASGKRVFGFTDCSPDVLSLLDTLLERCNALLIKASPMLDVSLACKQLAGVRSVEIIGYQDECKELLFYITRDGAAKPEVSAVELDDHGKETMRITKSETGSTPFTNPQAYVYDPPASLLKSGCFQEFAAQYGLSKLHADTHLFTSETAVANVPGRTFALVAVCAAQADTLTEYLPKARKANLRSVNFPVQTDVLKSRLKLKDGGDVYLFAVTLLNNQLAILICKRL